jgi:hypothetical protein
VKFAVSVAPFYGAVSIQKQQLTVVPTCFGKIQIDFVDRRLVKCLAKNR